ncbi:MAG: hypothetical protein JNJ45_00455 [Chthonomonas sp.]|nr:hypothetical protein [Chthonomonas sp.]
MASTEAQGRVNFGPIGNASVLVALIGIIGVGVGVATGAVGKQAYMFGFACYMAMVLGCLGLTLLHHVCRGSWSLSVLRILEAGGGPAAVGGLGLAFIPLWIFRNDFYHHWIHPEHPFAHWFKRAYFTETSWTIRAVMFLAIWFVISLAMRNSTRRQDTSGDLNEQHFRTNYGVAGLILFILTVTFASTDWIMSMDPHWTSSIFGVWFAISGALMALTFATALVLSNRNKAPYNEIVSHHLQKDLGNMCFAITMLWAYFTLSQWIIIWSGNLPEFTSYYVLRNQKAGWFLYLGGLNILVGFFVCWFAFLTPKVKRKPELLIKFCILACLVRFFDLYYCVMPFMRVTFSFWDIVAVGAFAALWLAIMGKESTKAPIVPEYDTRLQEIAHHAH